MPILATALRCLAIVARQHDLHLTPEQLVRDNVLPGEAVTPEQFVACAKGAGLVARFLRVDWDTLLTLNRALPAIINFRDGSSMVVTGVITKAGPERVVLRDPYAGGEGLIEVDQARLEQAWSGEVILIKRDYEVADEAQPMGFGLLRALILRDRRIVVDIMISAVVLSVVALAPILFFRLLADRVLVSKSMSTFTTLCTFALIIIAFEAVFSYLRKYLALLLTTRVDAKLSVHIFEKVMNLPLDFFERNQVGQISFQMNEMNKVRNFVLREAFGTCLDAIVLLVFIPLMFFLSIPLTAVLFVVCAVIVLWCLLTLPELRRRSGAMIKAEAAKNSFLVQSLGGIRTIKSLALTTRQQRQYDVHVARVAKLRLAHGRTSNLIQSVVTPLERLLRFGSIALAVYFAVSSDDPMSIGSMFAFIMLSQRVADLLVQLAQMPGQYDEARTSLDMVSQLVNQAPEEGRTGRGSRTLIQGGIEFMDVRFQYKGALTPALSDVSFEVPVGTTLGIMGRSGSGKTTVTRLLQRLHADYTGLIKIDGIDAREYDLDHLRLSMGVVLQDNFLFSGTIRENITIAKSDASFEDVVHAARLAGAEEFIDKLPRGYETHIHEGSPNLSGGQRQRLAIARALITNPRLLIFDEATSALDAESEAIVNANLARIARGRTMIIISHRLSSLIDADAILVLERGRVHDIGRHEDLLERCDIYSDLWHQQNGQRQVTQNKPAGLIGVRRAS